MAGVCLRLLLHGGAYRCRCESLDCGLFRPADRLAKLFLCVGVIGLVLAGVMWFIRDPEREVRTIRSPEQSDEPAQNFTAIIKTLAEALSHSPRW